MSADNENTPPRGPRFNLNVEDARARAQQAVRDSEIIFTRAYGLLREPKKEWEQIKAEQTTVPNLLIGYVAPLAAIPPIADLIGSAVFQPERIVSLSGSIVTAFVTWVLSVAMVFFLGVLINSVADQFDADRNDLAAQKIAACRS